MGKIQENNTKGNIESRFMSFSKKDRIIIGAAKETMEKDGRYVTVSEVLDIFEMIIKKK